LANSIFLIKGRDNYTDLSHQINIANINFSGLAK
jgi:hypothetical protein